VGSLIHIVRYQLTAKQPDFVEFENMSYDNRTPGNDRVYDLSDNGGAPVAGKVLMLEDDNEFSELLKAFLESNSLDVTCVANGVEGLRKIMTTDFDVILCDMVMPSLPGDMFYLAVERTKPHLCRRFIFMTGYKAVPKVDAFIRKVQGLVLWKPFQMQDLMAMVQTVQRQNAEQKT
jgi:DNA-binding NtrC family response regulator